MLTSQNEAMEIVGVVSSVARRAIEIKLPGCENRTGGYFCMARAGLGTMLLVPILHPAEEKARRSVMFCQEKSSRLAKNTEHLTSRESANEKLEQFPGAIKLDDLHDIFSIGGFPATVDEAILIRSGLLLGKISPSFAQQIFGRVPAEVQTYVLDLVL